MDAEGCELGPFTPVPDALVLAAIQRAQRHGYKQVARWQVAEHLGFVHNSATTRRLRPQLESLRVAGSLERARKHGQYQWALTPKGRRRLATARRAGRVGELPESPQHRRWRHAREEVERRIDDFRTLTYQTLDAAEAVAEPADGPGSETWFAMGDRLAAIFWLMGSATHCLTEWPEPDDARADRDNAPARKARAARRPGLVGIREKGQRSFPMTQKGTAPLSPGLHEGPRRRPQGGSENPLSAGVLPSFPRPLVKPRRRTGAPCLS